MITGICRELDISEHEFFSACDDLASRQIKKQAKRYQNIVRGVFWSILLSYVVAVVTCFICNLAIGHTLSWFFIVLVSLLLAFSVTNLPMILHRYQIKYQNIYLRGGCYSTCLLAAVGMLAVFGRRLVVVDCLSNCNLGTFDRLVGDRRDSVFADQWIF